MDCEEFLRQFREALDGKVSEGIIQDNVNYYRSYISGQTLNGKSEPEVLKRLGDPRLLAKTIEESSRFAAENQDSRSGYAGDYGYGNDTSTRNNDNVYAGTGNKKHFRLPAWLITGIVLVAVVLGLMLVFRAFVIFSPVIIAFLLGGVLVRTVRYWWKDR